MNSNPSVPLFEQGQILFGQGGKVAGQCYGFLAIREFPRKAN